MKNILFSLALLGLASITTINQAFAGSHCAPCPYSCDDIGLGHKDCSLLSASGGVCCLDLTSKGMQVALERERVQGPSHSAAQDRCPAGFSPSEQKCSQQERRNGCKDIRLPSGLGCVNR